MHPKPMLASDWRRIQIANGRCGTCGSTAPHMHPAVQHEGEVELCTDDFHLRPTPQNTAEYIERVRAKRAAQHQQ